MATVAAEPVEEKRMSLAGHLGELRTRLLRCTISVLVLGGVALVFSRPIYGVLMRPVLMSLPPDASQLIYTSAIEELNVFMKVGMYCGIFLTTPIILWQIWGFVAPGLFPAERKMALPFVLLGSLAFLAGALFCYFVLLPTMFQFLLREENSVAIEGRLKTGKLREEDALRYLRLGDLDRSGKLAKLAIADLTAEGDGKSSDDQGDLGVTLVPKRGVEVMSRLEGLGRVVDAAQGGLGAAARPVLIQVMEKRGQAIDALGSGDFSKASDLADGAASLLLSVAPTRTLEFGELWTLEKALSAGKAHYDAVNWTRPMLSMSEQLTLVLVLELAFGVIFELPLVMALLGLVGLLKSRFLMKYQRHAFVICLIIAAVITPTGDAINLALMAGPMLMCFELGVLAIWIIERRRARNAATTTLSPLE